MDVLRLPLWLTACAMIVMLVRRFRPEFATLIALAAGLGAFYLMKDELNGIIAWLRETGAAFQSTDGITSAMIRAAGIALLSEFAADICSDAGEHTMAGRILLAERVMLTGMCLPYAAGLLRDVEACIP